MQQGPLELSASLNWHAHELHRALQATSISSSRRRRSRSSLVTGPTLS